MSETHQSSGKETQEYTKHKAQGVVGHLSKDLSGWPVSKIKALTVPALIVTLCLVAYIPAMRGGFIWDDNYHLTNNVVLEENGLYKAWFTTKPFVYYPITWTSYWLEYQLWGLNPTGYHIVNVLLHAASALLIWRILIRLKVSGAWLAALIFALHPVNVESVAWITQRKNLLSMLFFLAASLYYLRFDDSGRRSLYWLAVACFVLAMLSKGAVVMLPVVLLMFAWWLRNTISRRDVLRSLPFFAVSAVMSVVEVWFQTVNVIGKDVVRDDSFFAQLATAGKIVWFYFYKALLPAKLCFIYPRWGADPTNWLCYIPDIALLALLGLFWRYRRGWARPALFAIGYFVLMLIPAMGFAHFYFLKYSLVADHYQYIAIIGVIALVTALAYHIAVRFETQRKNFAKTVAVLALGILSVLTWRQCRIYNDIERLWRDTLRKNPAAWMAHNNLGGILLTQGKLDEATSHFHRALQLNPNNIETYNNLGVISQAQGKFNAAIDYFNQALQLKPDAVEVFVNLGTTLQLQGKLNEAIDSFHQALQIRPDYPEAHCNLANTLSKQGKLNEAIGHLRQAIQAKPDYFEAHYNLGIELKSQGKIEEAISHYLRALQIEPDNAKAHNNLGIALAKQGRLDDAISYFRRALRIEPDWPPPLVAIAQILVAHPDPKIRDANQAIALAQRAAELTEYQNAMVLETLAASYATAGRFDRAVITAQKALALASAAQNDELTNNIRKKLERYLQAKP